MFVAAICQRHAIRLHIWDFCLLVFSRLAENWIHIIPLVFSLLLGWCLHATARSRTAVVGCWRFRWQKTARNAIATISFVCVWFIFVFIFNSSIVAECKTEDVRRGKMCVICCVVFCVCARARARSSSFSSAYYELMSNVTMVIASLVTFWIQINRMSDRRRVRERERDSF